MKVVESCLKEVNHLALCLCISDLRTQLTRGQSQGPDPFFAPLCFALVGATGNPPKRAKTAHSENYHLKGPFSAQLAPFGPSPRLLSPRLDFPDFCTLTSGLCSL